MTPEERDRLLDSYLHGTLTEAERSRVEALVSRDPEVAQRLAELSLVRCLLIRLGQRQSLLADFRAISQVGMDAPEESDLDDTAARLSDPDRVAEIQARADRQLQIFLAEQEALHRQQKQSPQRYHFDGRAVGRRVLSMVDRMVVMTSRTIVGMSVAAAVLLASLVGFRYLTRPAPEGPTMVGPTVVATLGKTLDATWEKTPAGTRLIPGRHVLTGGYAQIDFHNGAQVLLEAPCDFSLTSADAMFLSEGILTGKVSPQARGFTINTRTMKLVDLGTEFGLSVASQGSTQTAVFNGIVQVTGQTSTQPLVVSSLQQVKTSNQGIVGNVTALDPHHGYRRSWSDVLYLPKATGACKVLRSEPMDLESGRYESESMVIFLERHDVLLTQDLNSVTCKPGQVRIDAPPQDRLARGNRVDSYLVHFDPMNRSLANDVQVRATIHFPRPVLAIVSTETLLDATDAGLGLSHLNYPKQLLGRGIEPVAGKPLSDQILLADDRMSLSCTLWALHRIDQFRVLVEAAPQADESAPGM